MEKRSTWTGERTLKTRLRTGDITRNACNYKVTEHGSIFSVGLFLLKSLTLLVPTHVCEAISQRERERERKRERGEREGREREGGRVGAYGASSRMTLFVLLFPLHATYFCSKTEAECYHANLK